MSRRRSPRAMVLVTVLWVAVILTVLVASVGRTHRVDTKIRVFAAQQRRCAWAARGGVETALALLAQDDPSSDSLDELWHDNDVDYNDVAIGTCSVTIQVEDEAGKLNLNTASRDDLLGLPEMEPEVVDAILDWRDKDDEPRGEGVERGYYEELPFAYTSRNGPFQTPRELLLVRGVDETLFYGEDTNHNRHLDENEQDGEATLPYDDGDGELDPGWIDMVTCFSYDRNRDALGSKRVNINEADQRSLERRLNLNPGHAKWIVDNRRQGFKSLGDLINERSPREPAEDGADGDRAVALDLQTYAGIVDRITLTNEARIPGLVNVNTAPREVLVALFGGPGVGEEAAEGVLSYRAGQAYGLTSVGDLLEAGGVDVQAFKRVVDRVTVRSPVFSIRAVARAQQGVVSAAVMHAERVVDRSASPPRILYRYQGVGTE